MGNKGRPAIDLTGKQFGRLTPLEPNGRSSNGGLRWLCQCSCGDTTTTDAGDLRRGYVTSCGCYSREVQVARHDRCRDAMIGRVFGRLTVESVDRIKGEESESTYYRCSCTCSNTHVVSSGSLIGGGAQSCGCLAREINISRMTIHGLSRERIYMTWTHMLERCADLEDVNYGGRGILVCKEWKESIHNFVEWALASGYQDHLTIDRIDVNGNYEPGNCRWVTMADQARNRRSNVITGMDMANDIRNDPRTQIEIARDYGMSQTTVSRVKQGKTWS